MRPSVPLFLGGLILLGCGDSSRNGGGSGVATNDESSVDSGSSALMTPEPGVLENALLATDPTLNEGGTETDSLVRSVSHLDSPGWEVGGVPEFKHPEHIRGIYLNAWAAGAAGRRKALLALARRTEINTFVIDIKDASGYVSHPSRVPLAVEVGADLDLRIRDLPGLLRLLEEEGVYPIARIVVAKDPLLPLFRPELAIQDSAGGPWEDQNGHVWLNLYLPEVWQYHLDLAREVARLGFPEIQWDYVRFPDAPQSLMARAVFPGSEGLTRAQAIRDFLAYVREPLKEMNIRVTADVFGVTTSFRRDMGIGQLWESFIDQVDVALPMVYPSHYWKGNYGFDEPNAFPYEVVRAALRDAVRRSAQVPDAGAVRPWLQDFTLGDPPYGAPEVRAQVQAAYDAGITEWLLWNSRGQYTEAALLPSGGLPAWLEPVIRVGGEVVRVSERFRVLGEEDPEAGEDPKDSLHPDTVLPTMGPLSEAKTPPKSPPQTRQESGHSFEPAPGSAG